MNVAWTLLYRWLIIFVVWQGAVIMIGVRGITRFTSRMATTMMRPLSSSSSSSAILFHDVTAANADGLVANKISFKLEKGDRVALTGPNQEGIH
jgi:ABC-type multidrug transport system fused ATPase/permease subunit